MASRFSFSSGYATAAWKYGTARKRPRISISPLQMLNRGFSIVVRGIGHWLEIVYRLRRVTGRIPNRGVIKFGIEIVSVVFHRSKGRPPISFYHVRQPSRSFCGSLLGGSWRGGVGPTSKNTLTPPPCPTSRRSKTFSRLRPQRSVLLEYLPGRGR